VRAELGRCLYEGRHSHSHRAVYEGYGVAANSGTLADMLRQSPTHWSRTAVEEHVEVLMNQ